MKATSTTCDEARRHLARAREELGDAPVGVRFHLERCAACARLAARYGAGVSALARATAIPERVPAAAAVVAAARAPQGVGARVWAMRVALGVAVAGIAVGGIALATAPGPEERAGAPLAGGGGGPEAPVTAPDEVAPLSVEASRVTTGEAPAIVDDPALATLTVAPGSDVTLPTWSAGAADVVLARGAVDAAVRPRIGDQRFVVRTDELVATAVGTAFRVSREPGVGSRVTVQEGVVLVELAAGGEVTLGAGDVVDARAARTAAAPERAAEPAAAEVEAPAEAALAAGARWGRGCARRAGSWRGGERRTPWPRSRGVTARRRGSGHARAGAG
ncbi:MAG: FecR domain-containing protein [Deltaproteobacteria bacterium]|nr:FecR domain-containing protein [Deltaproteobacteria bacterium]